MMPETSPTRLADDRPFGRHDAWWVAPDYRLVERAGVRTIEPTEPFDPPHGGAAWRLVRPAELPGAPNLFAELANVALRPEKAPSGNALAFARRFGLLGLAESSHLRGEALGAFLEAAGEAARLLGSYHAHLDPGASREPGGERAPSVPFREIVRIVNERANKGHVPHLRGARAPRDGRPPVAP